MNSTLILAEMTTSFILSQVFVVICYGCLATTYALKSRKWILFLGFTSIIANGLSYMLLSAWSGLAMVGVALLRNIIFLIQNKKADDKTITAVDWVILGVLVAVSVISAIFTYDGFLSLFSIFATLLFSISVWQKNIMVYNIMGLITSILWIIYYIFIWSPFAIACESVLFTFMLVTLIMKLVKSKKQKNAMADNIEKPVVEEN